MTQSMISELQKVANARIYFGHHSVGDDMIRGLTSLAADERADGLRLIALEDDPKVADYPACFAHSRVGSNGDPLGKIRDFERRLRNELPRLDLAFMKLCYVDFDPNTDVQRIFDEYVGVLNHLESEFRDTHFVHSTVPLMVRDLSFKNRIKLLVGKSVWRDDSNVARCLFNEAIRREFPPSRILDIARIESTRPDGAREEFQKGGRKYYCLSPEYARDAGHLSGEGRRVVSMEMVRVLAQNL